ncbi:MAG TPA: hypothetical protein VKA08_09755 [Balneolales bacterium]|nr:hypothetical protein [Balneolales bacterium]
MKSLRNRDEIVTDTVYQKGIPLVLLLSGGYPTTLAETETAHASMFEDASRKI